MGDGLRLPVMADLMNRRMRRIKKKTYRGVAE